MERLEFKVAPYALENAIRALKQYEKGWHKEIWVTKEDGDLVIMLTKYPSYNKSDIGNTPVEV